MRVYRITRDVTGEAYKLLLEAALKEASTFSLVWPDQRPFAPSAAMRTTRQGAIPVRIIRRSGKWGCDSHARGGLLQSGLIGSVY